MGDIPKAVPHDLDFDVPGLVDIFFNVYGGIPKRHFRFVARSLTILIPRPPPPAVALIITGNPMSDAMVFAVLKSAMTPSEPGTTGTCAFFIVSLARALSPIALIASGGGPMNVRPEVPQISAKEAFSARNPYPG